MAKLTKYSQKVFGSSAGSDQMAEFGSFAAGAPLLYDGSTITPDIVQTLSNFLTGWKGAVVGNNSPLLQDFNALCYLYAYQLAYLIQQGVAEWDSATTYYTGGYATDGQFMYASRTDANTGNALTDGSNWNPFQQLGLVVPQTAANNTTIPANYTAVWPSLTIASGKTFTVEANAKSIHFDAVVCTGTLVAAGNVVVYA